MTEQLLAQQLESPSGTGRDDPEVSNTIRLQRTALERPAIDRPILTGHYAPLWPPGVTPLRSKHRTISTGC